MDLSRIAIILGGVIAAFGALAVAEPALTRRWLDGFPRNRWAGWILAGVGIVWSGILLYHTALGRFDQLKPLLYILVPVSVALVIRFMDELLAARALGGLFLLVPVPMLTAAQWHPSAWRFVITVLSYAVVVAGIALVLSPFEFRRCVEFCLKKRDSRCRACGAAGLALGLTLVILGLTAYSR